MTSAAVGARASRLVWCLTGLAAGSTAWMSLGVVAVVDPVRMTRVGALASYEWLGGLLVAGAIIGMAAGSRLWRAPLVALGLAWLPWLPVPVPAAFLLWDGPLETAIWLMAIVGAGWPLVARAGRSLGRAGAWWHEPRRAAWVAAALFVVLALAAWTIARPRVPAGDEPHYLVITQSLLRDGDLRIENNHRDEHYLEYYDAMLRPDFMRRGTNGQIYSIHAPGVSALVLPAFAVAGYPGAVAVVVAVGALGIAAVWHVAFLLTGVASAAWVATAAVATAAPFLLHAFTIYPDPVGGALTVAAVAVLVALDTRTRPVTGPALAAAGAALALLPWLHTRFAMIAGVLGVAIGLRLWRRDGGRAHLVRFLAVPAVSALAWFGYFYAIYGTPNPAAPYGTRPEGGLSFIPTGIAGLLLDQQFGLFAHAPVLVLAVAGLVVLARERRRLTVELLAVGVPYLATAASYPMWWGGFSAPARFVVVLVPLLALPMAVLWARAAVVTRRVILCLLVVSASMTALLVGHDRGALIYNGRDGAALWLDWLSRSVDLTLALPSVHRDGALMALADALVWTLAAVVLGAAAVLAGRLMPRLRHVAAWAAVPLAVMLATTIVWTGRARGPLTPSTSQMSWLERWSPAGTPVVVQLTPTRALTIDDAPRRLNIASSERGRRAADEPLLRLPDVPAGDYELFVEPQGTLAGGVTVRLGRQDVPMEQWRLEGRQAGFSGLVLRLPVDAHSITVHGDAAARASVRRLSLRPQRLAPGGEAAGTALRAARYGRVVVFALDDHADVEPGAVWVRGERTAAFVARADEGARVVLRLKAGPVANDVHVIAGGWSTVVRLAAGAEEDVPLPAAALAPAMVSVRSATGFRPSEHGGGGDVRWLGVYLTWPDTASPATGVAAP